MNADTTMPLVAAQQDKSEQGNFFTLHETDSERQEVLVRLENFLDAHEAAQRLTAWAGKPLALALNYVENGEVRDQVRVNEYRIEPDGTLTYG